MDVSSTTLALIIENNEERFVDALLDTLILGHRPDPLFHIFSIL